MMMMVMVWVATRKLMWDFLFHSNENVFFSSSDSRLAASISHRSAAVAFLLPRRRSNLRILVTMMIPTTKRTANPRPAEPTIRLMRSRIGRCTTMNIDLAQPKQPKHRDSMTRMTMITHCRRRIHVHPTTVSVHRPQRPSQPLAQPTMITIARLRLRSNALNRNSTMMTICHHRPSHWLTQDPTARMMTTTTMMMIMAIRSPLI